MSADAGGGRREEGLPDEEAPRDDGAPEGAGPAGDDPGAGVAPDPRELPGEDADERVGIFPSWRALYVTVLLWTAAMVGILYLFSVTFDHGVP